MIKKSFLYCIIGILFGFNFLFSSCESMYPEEIIPSYLHIDTIILEENPFLALGEGVLNHKITDAWVFVDGKLIGTYEMPFTVPVIAQGLKPVIILPGIKMNGIAGTRIYYPFYLKYETEVNFQAEQIHSISPVTHYIDDSVFPYMNNFETGATGFDVTINSDTIMEVTDVDVCNGAYSGMVRLEGDRKMFEVQSSDFFELPAHSNEVFLEMEYKNETEIVVGLTAYMSDQTTSSVSIFAINPSSEWNKIYVNLTPTLSYLGDAMKFKLYFGGILGEGQESAVNYFDNIKIVHHEQK
ncbi:MAG: hypothetical protein GX587_14815 [Bacteroidales bacterium]|nr:hypothetical protein [Bacteroidales bacterium]